MPYCRKCGSLQCDDYVFCTECGVRRTEPEQNAEETQNNVPLTNVNDAEDITQRMDEIPGFEHTQRAGVTDFNETVRADIDATVRANQPMDRPFQPAANAPVAKPAPAVAAAPKTESKSGGNTVMKVFASITMAATILVQFMPFYRFDFWFYETEMSLYKVIEHNLERGYLSGEEKVIFRLLLCGLIFSIIALMGALIYYIFSDGVGFPIGSLVFSLIVHSYVPFKYISENEDIFNEGIFTGFLFLYYILAAISFILLVCYNFSYNEGD